MQQNTIWNLAIKAEPRKMKSTEPMNLFFHLAGYQDGNQLEPFDRDNRTPRDLAQAQGHDHIVYLLDNPWPVNDKPLKCICGQVGNRAARNAGWTAVHLA